jgi:pimeloyl-ACP methyl ester carboxylesterase
VPHFENDKIPLYYNEIGDGPAVVWHTGGCGDGRMWDTSRYTALEGYRHVLFDHRGHGQSGAPAGLDGHAMPLYVSDLVTLLDHLELRQAAVVGYSLGARVAYATACEHPDRLTAVVGLDSVPTSTENEEEMREGRDEVLEKGTRPLIEAMSEDEAEPALSWLIDHLCTTEREQFAGGWEAFATSVDLWSKMTACPVPTLLLVADDGDETRVAAATELAETMPNGRAAFMPGLGHLQAFWRTDLSIPPMRDFLDEFGSPTA